MKKKLAIILAVLIVTTFTGCKFGGKSADGNADFVAGYNNGGDMFAGDRANPPNGNWNNAAALTGEVESVNGEEVTLKIIDMPGFGGMGGRDGMPNGGEQPRDGQMRSDNGAPPNMASGDTPRMNRRGDIASGDAPRMNRREDMASGDAPKMGITYTSETKIVTIPDEVLITKMSRGDNKNEQTELAIGDVKVGDIMMVWFSDESESAIERVSISDFGKKD